MTVPTIRHTIRGTLLALGTTVVLAACNKPNDDAAAIPPAEQAPAESTQPPVADPAPQPDAPQTSPPTPQNPPPDDGSDVEQRTPEQPSS